MSLQNERAQYTNTEGLPDHYTLPERNLEVRDHMTIM